VRVWDWSFGVAVSRVCGEVAKLAIVWAGLLAAWVVGEYSFLLKVVKNSPMM
jgi:hypothetical protein